MERALWRVIEKETGIVLDCGFSDTRDHANADALAACLAEVGMGTKQVIEIEIID